MEKVRARKDTTQDHHVTCWISLWTLPCQLRQSITEDHDFDAGKYTGKVRTTPIDVGFALLGAAPHVDVRIFPSCDGEELHPFSVRVFSTKPLAPNCKNFFQQFDAEGRGYLTHDQWMAFGGKVPLVAVCCIAASVSCKHARPHS
eukprot:856515-Amphidinium_carterae.1